MPDAPNTAGLTSARRRITGLLGMTALGAALVWALWIRPQDASEAAPSPSEAGLSDPRTATADAERTGHRPSQPDARVVLEDAPQELAAEADDGVAAALRRHLGEIVSLGPLSDTEAERALAIIEELARGREYRARRASEAASSGDPKAVHDAAVAMHEAKGFRLVPEALRTGFYFVQDPKTRHQFVPVLEGCYVTTFGLQSDSGSNLSLSIALPFDAFPDLLASNDYVRETRRLYLESLCDEFNRKEFDERKQSIETWRSLDSEQRRSSRMRKYMTYGIGVDRQRYLLQLL